MKPVRYGTLVPGDRYSLFDVLNTAVFVVGEHEDHMVIGPSGEPPGTGGYTKGDPEQLVYIGITEEPEPEPKKTFRLGDYIEMKDAFLALYQGHRVGITDADGDHIGDYQISDNRLVEIGHLKLHDSFVLSCDPDDTYQILQRQEFRRGLTIQQCAELFEDTKVRRQGESKWCTLIERQQHGALSLADLSASDWEAVIYE